MSLATLKKKTRAKYQSNISKNGFSIDNVKKYENKKKCCDIIVKQNYEIKGNACQSDYIKYIRGKNIKESTAKNTKVNKCDCPKTKRIGSKLYYPTLNWSEPPHATDYETYHLIHKNCPDKDGNIKPKPC